MLPIYQYLYLYALFCPCLLTAVQALELDLIRQTLRLYMALVSRAPRWAKASACLAIGPTTLARMNLYRFRVLQSQRTPASRCPPGPLGTLELVLSLLVPQLTIWNHGHYLQTPAIHTPTSARLEVDGLPYCMGDLNSL